ncbi:HupE/UreJ family protein [Arthrobacter pityocampae]|uniref:HupE/UreJ family protein n=1 Tax=Arthrobacter pityocampae TaxID=547334 RepID=UPI003735BAE8
MNRSLRVAATSIAAGVALAAVPAAVASAHPSETSAVLVTVHQADVALELQIPLDRYTLATDATIEATDTAVSDAASSIESYVLDHLEVADADGSFTTTVHSVSLDTVNDIPTLVVEATATAVDGSVGQDLSLAYDVVSERIATHDVYVSLVSDWYNGTVSDGDPQLLSVLSSASTTIGLDRADSSWWSGFLATMQLGMSHIAEGPDHLLFLGMLLLIAPCFAVMTGWRARWEHMPVRGWWAGGIGRRTALLVSAFTLGHTLSLALVSFGIVSLPAVVVETLVALSIVIAAVHAVRPLVRRGELLIAAAFGLIHGTAFATTLVDLQLDTGALIGAIVGFNVGVELAQLVAVALILPLLALASRRPAYRHLRLVLAVGGILAGTAWAVGILTGTDSVLAPLFDAVAAAPLMAWGLLAVACMLVWSLGASAHGRMLRRGGVQGAR